jgi:hypothetical protein
MLLASALASRRAPPLRLLDVSYGQPGPAGAAVLIPIRGGIPCFLNDLVLDCTWILDPYSGH